MANGHPQYIPVRLARGGGKTQLAVAWAADQLSFRRVPKLLAVGHCLGSTRSLVELITERVPELPRPAKIVTASPQHSELQIKGQRFDAAVIDNADLLPTVTQEYPYPHRPSDSGLKLFSVLADEVLAWTFGPILFTYTDPERLPEPLRSLI